MMGKGVDYLAYRVRRFSVVAMVMFPLFAIYNIGVFALGGARASYYELGLGISFLIWSATFIYPRKLAQADGSDKKKVISFVIFCLALFSALIWFPLNAIITKS